MGMMMMDTLPLWTYAVMCACVFLCISGEKNRVQDKVLPTTETKEVEFPLSKVKSNYIKPPPSGDKNQFTDNLGSASILIDSNKVSLNIGENNTDALVVRDMRYSINKTQEQITVPVLEYSNITRFGDEKVVENQINQDKKVTTTVKGHTMLSNILSPPLVSGSSEQINNSDADDKQLLSAAFQLQDTYQQQMAGEERNQSNSSFRKLDEKDMIESGRYNDSKILVVPGNEIIELTNQPSLNNSNTFTNVEGSNMYNVSHLKKEEHSLVHFPPLINAANVNVTSGITSVRDNSTEFSLTLESNLILINHTYQTSREESYFPLAPMIYNQSGEIVNPLRQPVIEPLQTNSEHNIIGDTFGVNLNDSNIAQYVYDGKEVNTATSKSNGKSLIHSSTSNQTIKANHTIVTVSINSSKNFQQEQNGNQSPTYKDKLTHVNSNETSNIIQTKNSELVLNKPMFSGNKTVHVIAAAKSNKTNSVLSNNATTVNHTADDNININSRTTNYSNHNTINGAMNKELSTTASKTKITTTTDETAHFLYYTYKDRLNSLQLQNTSRGPLNTQASVILSAITSTVTSLSSSALPGGANKYVSILSTSTQGPTPAYAIGDGYGYNDDYYDNDPNENEEDHSDKNDQEHYFLTGEAYNEEDSNYEYYEDQDEYGTGASGLNSAPGDNSDQQWLQHMENIQEYPVKKGNKGWHGTDHIGLWNHGQSSYHPIEHSFLKDNSLSLIVFYTWLAVVAIMLIISYVAFKHRQKITNFINEKKFTYRRRRSSKTEEGHQLLSPNPYA